MTTKITNESAEKQSQPQNGVCYLAATGQCQRPLCFYSHDMNSKPDGPGFALGVDGLFVGDGEAFSNHVYPISSSPCIAFHRGQCTRKICKFSHASEIEPLRKVHGQWVGSTTKAATPRATASEPRTPQPNYHHISPFFVPRPVYRLPKQIMGIEDVTPHTRRGRLCSNFQKGNCTRGKYCMFSHDIHRAIAPPGSARVD